MDLARKIRALYRGRCKSARASIGGKELTEATNRAADALDHFRANLNDRLAVPKETALGRDVYVFFLKSSRNRDGFASTREVRYPIRSAWATAKSVDDLETHLAGGAGDDAKGGFIVSRIQIFRLCFDDIHDLFARHFPDLRLVRFLRTGGDVCGFL